MKKYIREILTDLKLKPGQKKLEKPVPTDLDNDFDMATFATLPQSNNCAVQ